MSHDIVVGGEMGCDSHTLMGGPLPVLPQQQTCRMTQPTQSGLWMDDPTHVMLEGERCPPFRLFVCLSLRLTSSGMK